MKEADHIHLRCPGNMGLLGAIVQVFFPHKKKTAKYAGNWDWNSPQPRSYRFQQKIVRNTFLTRNMQVLVYGHWNETKNVKPFFTASYSEKEITQTIPRHIDKNQPIYLIFIGGLLVGKRPLLGLEVVKKLRGEQIPCVMHFYGDGPERNELEEYRFKNHLQNTVFFHGNVSSEEVKQALQKSHFLVFISKSEGWPKVVAEAMFWGCLPLTSAVSCVPEMIGNGERGDLIEPDVNKIVEKIKYYINNPFAYYIKCEEAMKWSREFTLEKFEDEVKKLMW
jgi:glycosyltransferase involved in cell wall biosynthesis